MKVSNMYVVSVWRKDSGNLDCYALPVEGLAFILFRAFKRDGLPVTILNVKTGVKDYANQGRN